MLSREGSVIMVQCMGNSQPKTLVKCGRVSDCYRLGIIETMLAYRLIK
jgi:hypothetical protein